MTDIQTSSEIALPKKPWLAFLLSLIFPGLGHLYVGSRFSALAYGLMSVGIGIGYYSSRSYLSRLAVLFIVPFVIFPAARDAANIARGKKKAVTGEESWIYVVWMLCCVGPFAIPLLWQNKKFSVPVKVVWTVIVLAVVAIFVLAISTIGKSYDQITQAIQG